MGITDYISGYKKAFNERKIERMEARAKREELEYKDLEKERLAAKHLADINIKREAQKAELSKANAINFRNTTAGRLVSAGKSMMQKMKSDAKKGNSLFNQAPSMNPFYDQKGKKKKNPFYD